MNNQMDYDNFNLIYKMIQQNCKKMDKVYEQISYMRKIINEINGFDNYEFLFSENIIELDDLEKVFLKFTKNFYALIDNPNEEIESMTNVKETLILYSKEKSAEEYKVFFENAGILINRLKKDTAVKEKELIFENIDRIKIKSSLSDIVRIFEAMKKSEIISMKTEIKQFAQLFFFRSI